MDASAKDPEKEQLAAKPASQSRTLMTQLIFPLDTNHHDTMFGGKLMEYMDKVAAISAMRHARKRVVTASTDSLDFLAPIHVGEVIEVEAFVTWTRRSSMEIYVSVHSENLYTGARQTTVTAFFTFVALNDAGRPSAVPKVIPESQFEQKLHDSAPDRHELRKRRKGDRSTKS
jgi:acyl-CoA hydrolase